MQVFLFYVIQNFARLLGFGGKTFLGAKQSCLGKMTPFQEDNDLSLNA